jgi:NADP-dependent 3-hydroxy acid dehydrogenase YdfG
MKRQHRGTILAASSMAGFVAYPGFPGYTAAEHGVNGPAALGQDVAVEALSD